MTYNLEFHEKALEEWRGLPQPVRERLKSKLAERLENPFVPKSRLSGRPTRYKIKLQREGVRLVYEVNHGTVTVRVIAVGPRARSAVYKAASKRV